jgi:UDP-N-acetylmuramoyl-tripeptide--D-alanyl-D-alanine ligase
MTLDEVREAVHGRWIARGQVRTVQGVTTDTRSAGAGQLFFALRGQRTDGHEYLCQAAEAGCAAAIVASDANVPSEVLAAFGAGVIAVADTTAALGDLAGRHRRLVSGPAVIGVTGSNGKTTVKRMIHHILSRRLRGTCSPKSFNNNIGLPLTLLGVSPGDDYVICEIGTNAPGEIAALSRMARPDLAVITSIGAAHLERLGSIERVAVEKASILESLADDGLGVIWADSPQLAKAVRHYRCRLIGFGESSEADLRLTGFAPAGGSQRFQLNGRLWVDLPMPGRHNAMNALAAIAAAQRFGVDQSDSVAALADFGGEAMRLEWIEVGGGALINDAYNANPASMAAAADVLAGCGRGRKVFVVGDMMELGEQARELHLEVGRAAGRLGVDLVIAVGPLGRYIAEGASEFGAATAGFESVRAAAQAAADLVRPGDTVLVKGSRAVGMEGLIPAIRAAMEAPRGADDGGGPKGPER